MERSLSDLDGIQSEIAGHREALSAIRLLRRHHPEDVCLSELHSLHDEGLQDAWDALKSLQFSCEHSWAFTGEGYHGSSAGDLYFTCGLCGLEKKEY